MNRQKYCFFLLLFFLFSPALTIQAQEEEYEKAFLEFDKEQQKKFEDFKNKADQEFAGFLRQTWEKFEAFDAVDAPIRPEPVIPVVFDDKKPAAPPVAIKPKEPEPELGKPIPGVYVPGKPYVPVRVDVPVVPPGESVHRTPVEFYGTIFRIATGVIEKTSLSGTGEGHVADAWSKLCKADHEQLIKDCMDLRDQKQLSDWGYLLLTKQIGVQLYGAHRTNDIAFLQMFLLNKSGYKVRLSKINDELKLMVAPAATLYGAPFITLEGNKYYIFESSKQKSTGVYTYKQEFANSKNFIALNISAVPAFEEEEYTRAFQSKGTPVLVQAVVNQNLVNFYKDYPQCDVLVHYKTPMSRELKNSLYPPLKAAVEGKSQKDAANILIHFVQTAFDYKTDGEQFGYEKPNFLEENFFYPFNDCEDRAMLYCTLVKDLLGLDVVLLDYPDHIASAVCFTESISGDYVLVDGKKFLICDPTYIGAPIGMCMDQYKNLSPEVLR